MNTLKCSLYINRDVADSATICAALLHDVLEDTDATIEEVKKIW